jgi:membrane-associated protease RseP (regulator of RpoE activity)
VTQLLVVLGLIAIILIHELAHLLVARATGIRATVFSLGFGYELWNREWRGIKWRIGLVPLGGYVRIPAIIPPDVEADKKVLLEDPPPGPESQLKWRFGFIPYHERLPETDEPRIPEPRLSADERVRIESAATSDELYLALNGQPQRENEDWHRIREEHAPDTYHRASWLRRSAVILAGSAVNVLGGALLLWLVMWVHTPLYETTWQISSVKNPDNSALVGQRVMQLNDEGLTRSDGRQLRDLDKIAKANPGKSLIMLDDGHVVALEAGGATLTNVKSTLIGRRDDISATEALSTTADTVSMIVTGTARVVTRVFVDEKARSQAGTVVGAVEQSPQARDFLPQYILLLSIGIGLINLLPLLPLDGGHFLMSTLRACRIRLRRSAYYGFGAAGFAFVMILFVIGLGNDIRAF